ncbi:MAG: hypothetical protein ACK5V3_07800 [Bdellovibrionales bacterium]
MRKVLEIFIFLIILSFSVSVLAAGEIKNVEVRQCNSNKKCFYLATPQAQSSQLGQVLSLTGGEFDLFTEGELEKKIVFDSGYWNLKQNIIKLIEGNANWLIFADTGKVLSEENSD